MNSETLNNDLYDINFRFLIIARDYARHFPLEACWKFNINEDQINELRELTLKELEELAKCNKAIFTIFPINENGLTSSVAAALK